MGNAPAVLIIEWQQQALAHHRLGADMEIPSVQRRIHREVARIYSECADGLIDMIKIVDEMEKEQDNEEEQG